VSGEPFRVVGVEQFVRGVRELERVAPSELNDELTEVAGGLLPAIRESTPVGDGSGGDPGRLRAGTTVVKVRGKPAFVNRQPYANTLHYGRRRRGVVKATKFVVRPVVAAAAHVEHEMTERLNRLLAKYLP